MKNNELHNVPEESIQLSISRLKLSFQHQYELGRASVKHSFLSLPEAIAGAFFAELVSAVAFLFTSKPGTLIVQGRLDDSLTAHIILTLAFAVSALIAYALKARSIKLNHVETEARNRAASNEVYALLHGTEYQDPSDLEYPALHYRDYDDYDYDCDDFSA